MPAARKANFWFFIRFNLICNKDLVICLCPIKAAGEPTTLNDKSHRTLCYRGAPISSTYYKPDPPTPDSLFITIVYIKDSLNYIVEIRNRSNGTPT